MAAVELQTGVLKEMNGDAPATSGGNKKKRLSVERLYQKKSQHEHILLRPDTYIGSVEEVNQQMWVYDEGVGMVFREVTFVPGLYKIFDEILVNAADNKQRDSRMNLIKITIDAENNKISIWNNGRGIPVEMHKEEKMYVPSLIFGHLLTSSNYDDEEQKVTGGRNGYGAKLCNIYSTEFSVETASSESGRKLKQTWRGNMLKAGEPKITDSKDDFTCITFKPDLSKFKMDTLSKDTVALMTRRAYDLAGTSRGVRVVLNGQTLKLKTFRDYVSLYLQSIRSSNQDGDEDEKPTQEPVVHEIVNDRWEICVASSTRGFQQISFVNSIATTKGGSHVSYIADQVVQSVMAAVAKKNKGGVAIKPFQIKNHTWVFINCLIVNPTFDSQTKENMTLKQAKFGSKCALSEGFLKKVLRCGIVEHVLEWARFKSEAQLKQKCHSTKHSKIRGIPKLDDANDAGTKNSKECTLILTEGDSAKALAISGLSIVGRDRYGVFPLRGKVLNVREASHKQIMDNAELSALIKILGLQYKKDYSGPGGLESLRYGHIMIMTDQDQDGSHIKGLLLNWMHYNWPSLFRHAGFLQEFITPIVKATKGKEEISFYSLPEFSCWLAATDNAKNWKIKYYKGLGTSTHREAKEYFAGMERHRIPFTYTGKEDDDCIKLAFSKKLAAERKEWITNWLQHRRDRRSQGMSESFLYDSQMKSLSYKDFVNKELILFSNADNERSIPSLVDGLKPGQRKVLFTCFKRNDKREVKVAQLAGSVSELSAYHHGEASLMGTIINMAQDYVGSNNVNLLLPVGQFGTRLHGGKDAASPRYIFTKLSPLARRLFPQSDEPNLRFLTEDNQRIEPEWYCPILPTVLLNGTEGIGTGYSTFVPNFDIRDVIRQVRRLIEGRELETIEPRYKGFMGTVAHVQPQRFAIFGAIGRLNETQLEITELPIRSWTQVYKESVLEPMLHGTDKSPSFIQDYREYHTEATVRFVVTLTAANMAIAEKEGLYKKFKLESRISTSNMVLFDSGGCLRRYDNVSEILKEFFVLRSKRYEMRKDYLEGQLQAEADKLSAQARFITEKISGKLVMENKPIKEIVQYLVKNGYPSDPIKAWKDERKKLEEGEDIAVSEAEDSDSDEAGSSSGPSSAGNGPDYDYLLDMRLRSITKEKKDELLRQRDNKNMELETLQSKTAHDLWKEDLDAFEKDLVVREAQEKDDAQAGQAVLKQAAKKNKNKATGGRAAKASAHLSMAATSTEPMGEFIPPDIPVFSDDAPKTSRKQKATDSVSEETTSGSAASGSAGASDAPSKPVSLLDRIKNSPPKKPAASDAKGGRKAAPKYLVDSEDSEADFAMSEDEEQVQRSPRSKRQASSKKYSFDESEESADDIVVSDDGDDSDFDADDDWDAAPKPKASPAKKAPAAAKAPVPKKPSTAKPKATQPAKRNIDSQSSEPGKDGRKTAAKKQVIDSDEDLPMSDGEDEVQPAPKSKRQTSSKKYNFADSEESEDDIVISDDADDSDFEADGGWDAAPKPKKAKAAAPAKKAPAAAKAPAAKKPAAAKAKTTQPVKSNTDSQSSESGKGGRKTAAKQQVIDSDENDVPMSDGEDEVQPAPKSKRQTSSKKYDFADSEESADDIVISDDGGDSDFDSDDDWDSAPKAKAKKTAKAKAPAAKKSAPAAKKPAADKPKATQAAKRKAESQTTEPAKKKKTTAGAASAKEKVPAAKKASAKSKPKKVVELSDDDDDMDAWAKEPAVPVTSPMSRVKRARQPIKYSFDESDESD